VLRERVEKLSCDFSIDDNYFAWQAFGRAYSNDESGPLPPYLKQEHFDAVRARADRVEVMNRSFTEYLRSRPDQSLDRYILLDAQDWMSDQQLNDLWDEITRTARPGARVIFRTAAAPSLLPGRVDDATLARWHYQAEQSLDLTRRDRSAIYGGFHLYVLAN
jgi:S-adenosylmethionine-diacylglycerol 3-amino-3-carboxypropyl transferase